MKIQATNVQWVVPYLFLILNSAYLEEKETDPNVNHIHFYYYPDSSDATSRTELNASDPDSIKDENLKQNVGAKIIVHGSQGRCNSTDFPLPSITEYLNVKEAGNATYNVLCVEYTDFTLPGNQLVPPGLMEGSQYTVNLVATWTAKLIRNLQNYEFISKLSDVHIIGHSMGAHVAGGIGYRVQELNNFAQNIGRVTGLDPGTPIGYDELDLDVLLDPSDAAFVDVYHTCQGRIGQKGRTGRVDFYPDGGSSQMECTNLPLWEQLLENTLGICSHGVVGKYWARSIRNQSINACQANSWAEYLEQKENDVCNNPAVFGEATPSSSHGRYYLSYPQQTNK